MCWCRPLSWIYCCRGFLHRLFAFAFAGFPFRAGGGVRTLSGVHLHSWRSCGVSFLTTQTILIPLRISRFVLITQLFPLFPTENLSVTWSHVTRCPEISLKRFTSQNCQPFNFRASPIFWNQRNKPFHLFSTSQFAPLSRSVRSIWSWSWAGSMLLE